MQQNSRQQNYQSRQTNLQEGIAKILTGFSLLAPKPFLSIDEHAERHRRLMSGPAERRGMLRLYPHQKIFLRLISQPQYRYGTMVASQQVGKGETLLCVFTYYVDQEPLPQLIVEDTLIPGAYNFSLGRIDTTIRDTPVLQDKFIDLDQKKKKGYTKFRKDYPGGPLILAGANSVSSLSSNPVAIVQIDEVDKYKVTKAGFSSDLAFGRTTSFRYKAKCIAYSTPSIAGSSEIWSMYEKSNQGVLIVTCKKCGTEQEFVFNDQVFKYSYDTDINGEKIITDAWYECANPECRHQINERERALMIAAERIEFKNPKVMDSLGMHVWAMYNPDVPMKRIAKEYLATFDKFGNTIPEKRKTFWNNVLGLPYQETDSARDPNMYADKLESYDAPDERMLLITAAVDVQKKYFQYRFVGWGYLEEPYILHGGKIEGDTTRTDTIMRLYDALTAPIKYKNGFETRPYAIMVDANYNSDKVHWFVKKLANDGFNAFAIIGRSYPKLPEFIKSKYNHKKYHTRIAYLNVERLADRINNWCEPMEDGTLGIHFSEHNCDAEFFEQFFSEHKVEIKNRGRVSHHKWQVKTVGMRNEESDLMRYNLGGIKLMDPLNWDRLKRDFDKRMKKYNDTPKNERSEMFSKKPKAAPKRSRDPFTDGYKPDKY